MSNSPKWSTSSNANTSDGEHNAQSRKRRTTVYDAVAGRVGVNGFLSPEQQWSRKAEPLTPEEVLLRSRNAPNEVEDYWYDADQHKTISKTLPDSDLVKAVHAYASDFYDRTTHDRGKHDLKSFDETALLAIGILLEEAVKDAIGETGDMALVEPRGLDSGLEETKQTQYQVKGRVKPPPTPEVQSEDSGELDEGGPPTKKQRQ